MHADLRCVGDGKGLIKSVANLVIFTMFQFGDVIAPSLGCLLSVVRHFIAMRDILAVRKSGQIGVMPKCTSGVALAM